MSPITISPNGRWLAYVPNNLPTTASLFVHEIVVNKQQVSVSPPILTITPDEQGDRPSIKLTWPTENQLSWVNEKGIWLANLATEPIEPFIAILPSTKTYQVQYTNPQNNNEESVTLTALYIPYEWSPDGHYLLVIDISSAGEGESNPFRILDSTGDLSFEIPNSMVGSISDEAFWLNSSQLFHFSITTGLGEVWSIDSDINLVERTNNLKTPASENGYQVLHDWLLLSNNHVRLAATGLNRNYSITAFFDLDLEKDNLAKLSSDINGFIGSLQWSPDGDHVIWNDLANKGTFLDDLNGDPPIDMTSIFGEYSCCWYWYEE